MSHKHESHSLVPYSTYIMVWLALLTLTGLTVTVAGLNFQDFAIITAIFIAAFKSVFVMNYFMHLKYESPLFRNMIYITVFTLAIIIGLTFTDISFR